MTRPAPSVTLFVLGVLTLLYSFFSPDGIKEVRALSAALEKQEVQNSELGEKVQSLKQEFHFITGDPRGIEREARDSLLLARPGERLFVFDEKE